VDLISPPRGIKNTKSYKVDIFTRTNFGELEIAQDDNANDGNIEYVHKDIEDTFLEAWLLIACTRKKR